MAFLSSGRVFRNRVIPVLLLRNRVLHKTRKFKDAKYVGDPRNAVKIFNDKGADEIVILDIDATLKGREPDYSLIEEIAAEAFMPLAYGGGITQVDQARRLLDIGVEKIIIGAKAVTDPEFVTSVASLCGSQSTIVCIDVKRTLFRHRCVVSHSARRKINSSPVALAQKLAGAGAGEIIIQSVDLDGEMTGYDLDLVHEVSNAVDLPVIALGGGGCLEDMVQVIKAGNASAAAAGSMFVFHGPHRAILITYPEDEDVRNALS